MIFPTEIHAMQLPEWITSERWGEHTLLRVNTTWSTFCISLYGAHALSYVPCGQKDLLWWSTRAFAQKGKPIRGGVPLCWPGFAENTEPFHGTARLQDWILVEAEMTEDYARLLLEPTLKHEVLQVSLEVLVSDRLVLRLHSQNLGSEVMELTQALHTYLQVSAWNDIALTGLDGCLFVDKLNAGSEGVQAGVLHPQEGIDRIYVHSGAVKVLDPGLNRVIWVRKAASGSTVVWHPAEKAATIADMDSAEAEHFICVEAANTHKDKVSLLPGDSWSLETVLSAEPLHV
ncbi:hypothetical protein C4K68_10965 [Pokkaliibacter plantistimulans]|uniref:Putative glucose-6-phosphate 1-epimerase n=2 Tax=Pseudomonadota TaxID=1224 RepID=A0A2S5KS80_9PROT|nr:hypothetical protein C4K68_10965 [Pokkaliibacter plantistimulans]